MKPHMTLGIAVLLLTCFPLNSAVSDEGDASEPLSAVKAEKEGVTLIVAIPQKCRANHIPLDAILINWSKEDVFYDATGHLFDCKIQLRTADGKAVPFSTLGANLFGGGAGSEGQFAVNIKLEVGKAREWEFDIATAFESLPPGKYHLSLTVSVNQQRSMDQKGRAITLEARNIPFQIQ